MELARELNGATTSEASPANRRVYPPSRALRSRLRRGAEEAAAELTGAAAGKDEFAAAAMRLLQSLGEREAYLGWTTVAVAAAYWRSSAAGTPYDRRILFLPSAAPGTAVNGAAHAIADRMAHVRRLAEGLGYRVVLTDDREEAMRQASFGPVGAVFGAADLDVLEKAFDLLSPLELPALAIPLPVEGEDLDLDWLEEIVRTPFAPDGASSGRYAQMLAVSQSLAEPDELARLAGHQIDSHRDDRRPPRPLAATEEIAFGFLGSGGKHFRPFITLAVYDALRSNSEAPVDERPRFPDAVRRLALAIETFHKASLVHDDIEDADDFRYGLPTLHAQFGEASAINVGDYLIGLGYRLISDCRGELSLEAVADVTAHLADAHLRLAQGQGAEIAWRDTEAKDLSPEEALEIYELKTAPAFEAAFFAGLRAADANDEATLQFAREFTRCLGVAFQILNDLKDWSEDAANKMASGGDVLGARPTLLWALALQSLSAPEADKLHSLVAAGKSGPNVIEAVRRIYLDAGVFAAAVEHLEDQRRRGERLVENSPEQLRSLCRFLLDAALCDAEVVVPAG